MKVSELTVDDIEVYLHMMPYDLYVSEKKSM